MESRDDQNRMNTGEMAERAEPEKKEEIAEMSQPSEKPEKTEKTEKTEARFRKDSLTGKMVQRLLTGIAVGAFLILTFYFGGKSLLEQYFITSGIFYTAEEARMEEFQAYVTQNGLVSTDTEAFRMWAQERNIDEFTISRDDLLLFDVSYEGELYPGAKELSELSWRYFYKITFADGDAQVYIYEGAASAYYNALLALSALLGFAACMSVFISGMQEDVRYIQVLEREVSQIQAGDLTQKVTIQGSNELASLASGLDRMRNTLADKEQTEKELRKAQEKLVLGMAHDTRTPLTGLMTCMEIIKRQEQEGHVSREYIDRAFDAILQIKTLSDQTFEYFLVDSHKQAELESPDELIVVFDDYLSELCALLVSCGFEVNADDLNWEPLFVQISLDYMGRIVNNIVSNIDKYADRGQAVWLALEYNEPGYVGITVENAIAQPNRHVEGSGIGVTNVSMMMRQMGGRAEVGMTETDYRITLWFPVAECDAE